jgi:large subunit ribosomal protein L25
MLVLSAKIRKIIGKKVKSLRKKGIIPAVVYGPKMDNLNLEIEEKEFEKVLKKAGESSLISLKVSSEGSKEVKKFSVLIHDLQKDPITEKIRHIDFYKPSVREKLKISVPLKFEGESPAVKELGGTLVKILSEIEIRAPVEKLPREIKVKIDKLKTFEDAILVSDLVLPAEVEVLRNKNEIIAKVLPPEKIEEEKKPIEEKPKEEKKEAE